jgi:hypothetical protein
MAAAWSRARAAGLALAAAVAGLAALPAPAQQSLDQQVYVPPPREGRIETAPLPPIGGDAGESARRPAGAAAGAGLDGGDVTLPQPRFVRVPSAGDEARAAARDGVAGGGAQGGGVQDQGWERSPDGRFHRAPPPKEPDGSQALAPGPVVPIEPAATDLRAGVRLRELDKMTGQTKTFELGVGETREIDRLRIELAACRSPEGNDVHGTMAFLKVWDTRSPEVAAFSGWMFAESPALSALDHPRYDLWVISCTTSAVATSEPSE